MFILMDNGSDNCISNPAKTSSCIIFSTQYELVWYHGLAIFLQCQGVVILNMFLEDMMNLAKLCDSLILRFIWRIL